MKPRVLAAACALAAGLCGVSALAATAGSSDTDRQLALRKFQFEQMLAFQRARGAAMVPRSPYDPMPRLTLPDAKTQFQRAGGKLIVPQTLSTQDLLLERAIAKTYEKMLLGPGSGCCPCITAGSCNNSLFCDGVEVCTSGNCAHGTAVACNDGNPCTNDSCTENTDTCSFTPVPPPPVVAQLDLRRSAPGSVVATLTWSASAGATSYNVYRGTNTNLSNLACFLSGVTSTTQNDDGATPAKAFYLITSKACFESGLGNGNPSPRPAPPGCP